MQSSVSFDEKNEGISKGHDSGVMMRQLGAACVVTLSMSQALAISPDKAFEKLVESKSVAECLAQPNDACVFELTWTAAVATKWFPNGSGNFNLEDVVRLQARNGFFDRALFTVSEIDKGSGTFKNALAYIAVEQARAGLVEEARQTAHAGTLYASQFIRALCAIASAQARAEDEYSKESLSAAIAIAERHFLGHDANGGFNNGRAWYYIAEAQLDVNGLVGAQKSLERMKRANSDAYWVVLALNDIAMAQASAGLESQALETFSEARRLARRSGTEVQWFSPTEVQLFSPLSLTRVAVAQTRTGFVTDAEASFREAVETAREVKDILKLTDILSYVSQAQQEAGLHRDAHATAKIAVEAARARVDELTATLSSYDFDLGTRIAEAFEALLDLASAQIFAGQIREAESTVGRITVGRIHRLSESHYHPYFSEFYYAQAMAELAIAQWSIGRGSDATATIDAAEESARKFDFESGGRGMRGGDHWYKVAVARATVGDVRGALRIGEQHTNHTRFRIFQGVAELMVEGVEGCCIARNFVRDFLVDF